MRRQLVQDDPVRAPRSRRSARPSSRSISSVPAVELGDRDAEAVRRLAQRVRLRRANVHELLRGAWRRTRRRPCRRSAAPPDHDQVVCRHRHLAHQVRRDETVRPSAARALEQVPDPVDALGVEPVHRLVQHQRRGSPSSAAAIPSRWPMPSENLPARFLRHVVQADQVDQLVDAPASRCRASARAPADGCRPTAGVHRARLEQRADLVQRGGVVAVALAVDGHAPGRRASRPRISRIVVDFPEPFGPRKPVTIPGRT